MVQTVWKVTRILELFSAEDPEWGVSKVGRTLGIPKSTAFELMNSLVDQRFLQRTGKGRYRLGWRLFEFSQSLLDIMRCRSQASEIMWQLVETWGETSHLAVLDGVEAVYIEKLRPVRAAEMLPSPPTGARLPAHCTGLGKVLLAYQEWDTIACLLELEGLSALTPNTITTLKGLAYELEGIRECGYGYEDEEASAGLSCVAAPIYDARNRVIAAVSLSVPPFSLRNGNNKYTVAVLEAARRISTSASRTTETYGEGKKLQRA